MPPTEPTPPPIRELPDDYDQDVDRLTSKYRLPDDLEPEMRAIERELSDLVGGGITVCDVLRTAVRAALSERDTALRERCERLRQIVGLAKLERDSVRNECFDVWAECGNRISECLDALEPGDLADDLRPRGGDET